MFSNLIFRIILVSTSLKYQLDFEKPQSIIQNFLI